MATFNAKNFRLAGINAVFFDLDNTLIETRKADSRTCRKSSFEGITIRTNEHFNVIVLSLTKETIEK
ncbi:N-acylneuraminate-9-phosphatase [Vespula maculifrons]|uniref:Uncharacterized protein n=2 Tax=Vespula TaxID=7451 RepID=A0A834JIR5_VESVU|nr:hypothetical protein HZH66_010320 [Vespula vulgaris]